MSDAEPFGNRPVPPLPRPEGRGLVSSDAAANPGAEELARILAHAAAGDRSAWESLVRLYGRRLYALARSRRLAHDTAEEIAQSVFATIASKLTQPDSSGYREQGRFESWLFRIAMNRVRDEIRRQQRHATPADPSQFAEAIHPSDDPSMADHDLLAQLRSAMAQLPDADREVIELRHHAGLDFRRIADILGQPLGTVLARHHRALRKLKELMNPPAASDGSSV